MSSGHGGAQAHHFEDMDQQRESASLGMWTFLITEVLFFGGLFTAYTVYRFQYPQAFAEGSHHLDVMLGAVNTAVLIFSSLTMALAVRAGQLGKRNGVVFFLVLTILLGGLFLGIKSVEYAHKWHEHLVPGAHFTTETVHGPQVQLFFSLYFAMTGMHAFHMLIGAGLMVWLIVKTLRGRFSTEYYAPIEMVGLYWHFVDIVWIFLFPLLYLLGRH
ncbi:MAG: cytochrome c oxidase subunit 3 family protein [bacterium]|nr:cytochrome c oxidase subunit 3 family protein [bacterium]